MRRIGKNITGNCDSLIFLGGKQSTLDYLSKAMGKQTINVLSHGRTRGRSSGSSVNDSTKGREIMTQMGKLARWMMINVFC